MEDIQLFKTHLFKLFKYSGFLTPIFAGLSYFIYFILEKNYLNQYKIDYTFISLDYNLILNIFFYLLVIVLLSLIYIVLYSSDLYLKNYIYKFKKQNKILNLIYNIFFYEYNKYIDFFIYSFYTLLISYLAFNLYLFNTEIIDKLDDTISIELILPILFGSSIYHAFKLNKINIILKYILVIFSSIALLVCSVQLSYIKMDAKKLMLTLTNGDTCHVIRNYSRNVLCHYPSNEVNYNYYTIVNKEEVDDLKFFSLNDVDYNVYDVLALINIERIKRDLTELSYNNKLEEAAQAKSMHMSEYEYFSHVSPIDGREWKDFIHDAGYDYSEAGENLANGYRSSIELVKSWSISKSHAENMYNPNVSEIGIGISYGELDGYPTVFITTMFGNPM